MSGRQLALILERSEKYVRTRLDDTFEFALNDVEAFATRVLDQDPEDFVGDIERSPRRPPVPIRPSVGGATDANDLHDAALDDVAATTDTSSVDPSREAP